MKSKSFDRKIPVRFIRPVPIGWKSLRSLSSPTSQSVLSRKVNATPFNSTFHSTILVVFHVYPRSQPVSSPSFPSQIYDPRSRETPTQSAFYDCNLEIPLCSLPPASIFLFFTTRWRVDSIIIWNSKRIVIFEIVPEAQKFINDRRLNFSSETIFNRKLICRFHLFF